MPARSSTSLPACHLAAAPRRVVSREELLRSVWDSSGEWQDAETVTEHVRRVRTKLQARERTERIATIRGVGYRFEPATAERCAPARRSPLLPR